MLEARLPWSAGAATEAAPEEAGLSTSWGDLPAPATESSGAVHCLPDGAPADNASGALTTPGCVGAASGAADSPENRPAAVLLETHLAYLSTARAARDSDRPRSRSPASSAREDRS